MISAALYVLNNIQAFFLYLLSPLFTAIRCQVSTANIMMQMADEGRLMADNDDLDKDSIGGGVEELNNILMKDILDINCQLYLI